MTAEVFTFEEIDYPWWLTLLEGISALILGVILFMSPGMSLLILVTFIGFFWMVRGLFQIISIFIDSAAWGWKLFMGILGIVAGILVVQHPLWSSVLLPATAAIIIGVQGIIVGIIGLIFAFKGSGWGAGILGVLSIIFGVVLILNPLIAGLTLVLVIAGFAVIGGIISIVMAFRLRSEQK